MRIVAHMGGNGRVLQEVDLVAQSQQGIGKGLLLGGMVDGDQDSGSSDWRVAAHDQSPPQALA